MQMYCWRWPTAAPREVQFAEMFAMTRPEPIAPRIRRIRRELMAAARGDLDAGQEWPATRIGERELDAALRDLGTSTLWLWATPLLLRLLLLCALLWAAVIVAVWWLVGVTP